MAELYGLLADFPSARALLEATRAAREAGYSRMEAFSPFPIEELEAPLGLCDRRIWHYGVAGALLGTALGFGLQVYAHLDYPLEIGGRPLIGVPAFLVVTFLVMVLCAVLATVLGLFGLCGLPLLHHPLFDAQAFKGVMDDRFLLCIRADDPGFELTRTALWLTERAVSVSEVPA